VAQIVSNIVDCYVFRRVSPSVEFLLLKRNPASCLGQTWQAVHGKIEPGETAWQAAVRELREETGLAPLRLWQVDFVNTFYVARLDRVLMCPCFAAEADRTADVVLSAEHTEYAWVRADDVLRRLMWPGQRSAVREILDEIVTPGLAEPHLRIGDFAGTTET
jgi:dATP pyrophosphohydrolase